MKESSHRNTYRSLLCQKRFLHRKGVYKGLQMKQPPTPAFNYRGNCLSKFRVFRALITEKITKSNCAGRFLK